MRHSITALLIAAVLAPLGGCGQTGPLYMPPEETPEVQPAPPADAAQQPGKES